MIKRITKSLLKDNRLISQLLPTAIYLYLQLVYLSSNWQFVWPENYSRDKFLAESGVIFALWHNRLAFGPGIFKHHQDLCALVSPHTDGQIVNSIISKFGFAVITGSTNKNPAGALRLMIKKLASGGNVVITPDGPRGPVYKINSNISQIAKKFDAKLVPVTVNCSRYFQLNSWDKLMIPLPFSKIQVLVSRPLVLSDQAGENNHQLINHLNNNFS